VTLCCKSYEVLVCKVSATALLGVACLLGWFSCCPVSALELWAVEWQADERGSEMRTDLHVTLFDIDNGLTWCGCAEIVAYFCCCLACCLLSVLCMGVCTQHRYLVPGGTAVPGR
jgi:hypothetical protein